MTDDETTTTTEEPAESTTEEEVSHLGGATQAMLSALWTETPAEEIHFRQAYGKNGQPVMKDGAPLQLAYVTARYVQDRLDMTVGPGNWKTEFESLPSGAVRCRLSIYVLRPHFVEGEWIGKTDVGVPSSIEPDKGAHSDAFKRAGVLWGIARDLYDDRDEREPAQPQVQQNVPTVPVVPSVRQQIETGVVPQAIQQQNAQWVCPLHNDVVIRPAGVSKRTGKPYPAFYACPVPGCDNTQNI